MQFKKKSLTTFFVYSEKGQLKGRTLIGGFAVATCYPVNN